jgi:hypothetical protein
VCADYGSIYIIAYKNNPRAGRVNAVNDVINQYNEQGLGLDSAPFSLLNVTGYVRLYPDSTGSVRNSMTSDYDKYVTGIAYPLTRTLVPDIYPDADGQTVPYRHVHFDRTDMTSQTQWLGNSAFNNLENYNISIVVTAPNGQRNQRTRSLTPPASSLTLTRTRARVLFVLSLSRVGGAERAVGLDPGLCAGKSRKPQRCTALPAATLRALFRTRLTVCGMCCAVPCRAIAIEFHMHSH